MNSVPLRGQHPPGSPPYLRCKLCLAAGTLLGGITFRNVLVRFDRANRRVGFGPGGHGLGCVFGTRVWELVVGTAGLQGLMNQMLHIAGAG